MRCAARRFSGVSTVAVLPQATGSREQQRRGEIRAHEIDVVHGGKHGALLAVPALDEPEQVGRGLGIDRVEPIERTWFSPRRSVRDA
jgi:hypothetical protein